MKKQKFLTKLAIVFCVLNTSCSSTTLSVRSTPDKANIKIGRLGTEKMVDLGQTPLDMKSAEVIEKLGGDTPFVLSIEKEGYEAYELIVTSLPNADITLKQNLSVSSGFDSTAKTNNIIEGIFEAQRLARAKRFTAALEKLGELKKVIPQVAVIYELEGGIYYIQSKYNSSMDAYNKAIQYNPTSAEAQQMLTILEKDHGIARIPDEVVEESSSNRLPAKAEVEAEPAEGTE